MTWRDSHFIAIYIFLHMGKPIAMAAFEQFLTELVVAINHEDGKQIAHKILIKEAPLRQVIFGTDVVFEVFE